VPTDHRDELDGPRPASAVELQAVIFEERKGVAFLQVRDASGALRIVSLGDRERLVIGRNPAAHLCIDWDGEVSGLHAQVERAANEYTLDDAGLSRNGSFVNGERIHGRRRLYDGDMLRFGRTAVAIRIPQATATAATILAGDALTPAALSVQQRKVLTALCRPMLDDDPTATPATNQEIADELFLSVEAIKVHLRAMFEKFDVADLAQNRKRRALAARALQSGLVSRRDT